ncbi:MAG: dihydrofolate reductase [Myxococcota bacterium]
MPPLALIVAMARHRIIGRGNDLPWRVPEDLAHFRRVTTGHAIIMGRRTHESIGRPLPKRRNIVVTRQTDLRIDGCDVVHSLDEGIRLARQGGDDTPIVIGGAHLYAEALPRATRLYITEIDRDVEGDVRFPAFDRTAFREVERRPGESPDVSFVTLEREGV